MLFQIISALKMVIKVVIFCKNCLKIQLYHFEYFYSRVLWGLSSEKGVGRNFCNVKLFLIP